MNYQLMETNQNVIRYIGQYSVMQRVSDDMFNANSYLHSINGNYDCDSDIDEYIEQCDFKDFISKEDGVAYMPYFVFVDFVSYLSGFNLSSFTLCMDDKWRESKGFGKCEFNN